MVVRRARKLDILLIAICLIGGWVIAAATAHAGSTWELYWKWYGDAPGQFAYGTVNGTTFTSADITCTVNGTAIPRPGNQATMHCTATNWTSVTNGIIQTRDATKFVYYGTGTGSPASTRDMGNGTVGNVFISYTTLQPAY